MRAVAIDQAERAGFIAKQNDILPEQADRLDRPVVGQFLEQGGRLPVSAQQRPGRRARAGFRHQIILLDAHHQK